MFGGTIEVVVLLVIVCIALGWFKRRHADVTVVRSSIDNREYLVQNKPDKQRAADLLAELRQRMTKLVNHVARKIPEASNQAEYTSPQQSAGGSRTRLDALQQLVQRFDPDSLSEGNDDEKYTTYTLDKGEKIVFCLRQRDGSERLHRINMMSFVAIHELGHVMTKSQGHTPEFNDNFAWLLKEAVDIGVYQPQDFRSNPQTYCGLEVTDTPLDESFFQAQA